MKEFIKIDLENVFNHKTFLPLGEELKLENPYGELGLKFYDAATYPNSLEIISVENVPFIFPDKDVHKYDNITCMEQLISVQESIYHKIHFIGFSIVGNYNDTAILKFNDESEEEIEISLLDRARLAFRKEQPSSSGFKFMDEVYSSEQESVKPVLFGKTRHGNVTGFTYCQVSIENNCKTLKEIKLPNNPYMHILAITLE